MSQENVEITRRCIEAIGRAFEAYWEDPSSLATAMEAGDLPPDAREVFRYLDSGVEWNTAFAGVSFRGHLECARGFDWLLEAVEHYSLTLQEVTDLGDAQVLAVMDRALEGRDSGIEVNAPLFSVITVRNGLIVRNDEYSHRTEALEAAGLSE